MAHTFTYWKGRNEANGMLKISMAPGALWSTCSVCDVLTTATLVKNSQRRKYWVNGKWTSKYTCAVPLRKVRDWLFDYFSTIEGNKMMEVIGDIADCEVESFAEARARVDARIDMWRMWLDGCRPCPSPIYEPEAFQTWVNAKKALQAKIDAEKTK